MAVKRSLSAGRMLSVFELVARRQPIGVSAVARELGADKSAVQRDLMTLADAGWIRQLSGSRGLWELSLHIMTLARPPHSNDGLRLRLRPVLERLHAETNETVYLTLPYQKHFLVFDALESRHVHRVVRPVGMTVPLDGSATAKAVLPFLAEAEQEALLGAPPDAALLRDFARTRELGFAVNDGDVVPGSVAIAAPIVRRDRPAGAIVVVGPSERLAPEQWAGIGQLLRDGARMAALLWPDEPAEARPLLTEGAI